jgi:hypothetical protein
MERDFQGFLPKGGKEVVMYGLLYIIAVPTFILLLPVVMLSSPLLLIAIGGGATLAAVAKAQAQ